MRLVAIASAMFVALGLFAGHPFGHAAETGKVHRLAVHVDTSDADVMNMALNNAENAIEHYNSKGEEIQVEIVAYGPGLHMLRADSSPVKDRIKRMKEVRSVTFSACGVTRAAMEKRESKPIELIPQASVVPSGVVRLMELEEQGWSYVRP